MAISLVQRQLFIDAYCAAALWSSQDTHPTTQEIVSLDDFEWAEGEESNRAQECDEFIAYSLALILEYVEKADHSPAHDGWELAGHDFWLTRNGHGVGFWDRGLGELGDKLTEAAKTFGEVNLYLGDDELVHS